MDQLLENHMYATHAMVAAGSVALGTAVTYPLDTLKTIIQVGSVSGKQLTPTQALQRVRAFSGYSGLYSGFNWLAIGRTLGVGARFGVYEILTAFHKDGREDNYVYVNEALIAGMAAGATESILSSPFELMRIRAQVSAASRVPSSKSNLEKRAIGSSLSERLLRGYSPNKSVLNEYVGLLSTISSKSPKMVGALQEYPWMMTGSGKPPSACDVKRLSDIISLEGWKGLWRGFRSGVARDSFFAGIFFSTWQFIHQAMLDWKAVGMDPPPRSDEEIGPLSPLGVSAAAGFSGMVGAAGSHWFDTAKARSQCTVLPKYVTMERKLLKWGIPGNRFERYTGIHPSDRNLLLRGFWLRTARSGIASFLIVGSYFLAVDHLISSSNY